MNEMTVFFTTHYMEEAANADYVIIIDNGRIAARGPRPSSRELFKDRLILSTRGPKKYLPCLTG